MKKYILFLTMTLLAFVSCQKDIMNPVSEGGSDQRTEFRVKADLGLFDGNDDAETKAVANAIVRLTWTEGDRLSAVNLTTGKALGGELIADGSGASTTFSGSLIGSVNPGDKIAFIYPPQGYTEEQDFQEISLDLGKQDGSSAVPLVVCGVNTIGRGSVQSLSIGFSYLMSYFHLSLTELPESSSLKTVRFYGMGARTTLSINDSRDGFASVPTNDAIEVSSPSLSTNENGVKTVYIAGFASEGGIRREIEVEAGGSKYSTVWTAASLGTGKYYTSVIAAFEKRASYVEITVEKAGTLESAIAEAGYSTGAIKALKVSGPLNGNDILIIRNMLSMAQQSYWTARGSLEDLDMSGASIVSGGTYYYASSYDDGYVARYTSSDVLGTHMFCNCSQLRHLVLPSNLKSISFQAFVNCSNLKSLVIPASVDYISDRFYSGSKEFFDNLEIVPDNPALRIEGGCIYKGTTLVWSFPYNVEVNVAEGTTEIADGAFIYGSEYNNEMRTYSNGYLEMVLLPESLEKIAKSAFYKCSSLKSIKIPDNVRTVGYNAFYGCTSLQDVSISSGMTDLAQSLFSDCKSLRRLYIPSSIKSISNYVFEGCSNLFDVYCLASTVPRIEQSGNTLPNGATVHVLEGMKNDYLSTSWNSISKGNIDDSIVKYVENGVDYGYGIPLLVKVGSRYEVLTWAPVNCGYSEQYPYGKLYQWGRRDGQGYGNANSSDEAGRTVTVRSASDAVPSGSTLVNPDADTFYSNSYDWYSLTAADCLSSDWNKLDKSAAIGNPCPDGWRVPTYNEMRALAMSISSFTEKDGIPGFYHRGYDSNLSDDQSVFLPKSGYRSYGGSVYSRDKYSSSTYYWTSTPGTGRSYFVDIRTGEGGISTQSMSGYRAYGFPVRCVRGSVESIIETPDITVSTRDVTSNSVYVDISVKSDGNSPITEIGFKYGLSTASMTVQALAPGKTSYSYRIDNLISGEKFYVKAYARNDAGLKETTSIEFTTQARTSTGSPSYTAVDMGLPSGLKWASANIGASMPEEAGLYFGWGETVGYRYPCNRSFNDANHFAALGSSASGNYKDYGSALDPLKDIVNNAKDSSVHLPASNDAATVIMGGTWRMPTYDDYVELLDNCTYAFKVQNGVSGIQLVSKTNGNSIFFPFAGRISGSYRNSFDDNVELWTSSPYNVTHARTLSFSSYGPSKNDTASRYYGHTIRAVRP